MKHKKEILITVIIFLFLPILVGMFFLFLKVKPLTDDKVIKMYTKAANSVSEGKGVQVDPNALIAIDAVRYKQDFSSVSLSDAKKLAEKFIKKEVKIIKRTVNGKKVKTKKIVYSLRSLDEVLSILSISGSDEEDVKIYYEYGFADNGSINNYPTGPPPENADEFISKVKDGAIETYKKYKVLPSITIAQSIIESAWGKSAPGNNLFGIKKDGPTSPYWDGSYQYLSTTEYNGVSTVAAFRTYKNWHDSVMDHGYFIYVNSVYRENGFFDNMTYECQAMALQNAHYATAQDKNGNYIYASVLEGIIKQNKLDKYDKEVTGQ